MCEIFFPIGLMIILLILRKAFEIDKYDFDVEEQNTENFIRQKSMANVDLDNPNITTLDNRTFLWNGLTILPALYICSEYNRQRTPRPMIASIGIPIEIKQKIIYDSIIYQSLFNISVTNDNFMDFSSVDEMEDYVKDSQYGTEGKPLICFGMRLEEKDNSYNYSLHYFDSIFDEGIQDLDDIIEGPFDLFQSGPDMESYEKYQYSGYTYIMKCINEYILKNVLMKRFEDSFIRRKKDFYFRGIKGINKISKNSINNKCLFNSTNSWLNNYSGLTGFIANSQGQAQPLQIVEKTNNTVNEVNGSNSSICLNNNEIGLVGKGKNRHYMENIMENNDDRNLEGENTIEEKAQILNFIYEDDLKRKITKNDIQWEDNYYDIYNPNIDDNLLEQNSDKEEYDIIIKNKQKNKSFYQAFNINKNSIITKPYYINSESNINNNSRSYKNSLHLLFNNSKSLGSTNNSSNIMFKSSIRDKDTKSLSSFLNGNQIINIQNNSILKSSSKHNTNIKNKLVSLSLINQEKKLIKCNRTPSFTKTRIIDLASTTEKKLNSNNGRSCIDLKNIHKKILFNYTANIKKEIIDNITLKIKNVIHNNKREIINQNKNFYNMNKNLNYIQTSIRIIISILELHNLSQ